MRESSVEKQICDHAATLGVISEKQNGLGNRGKADQRFERNGVAGFLEIKRPGQSPTKLQLRYLKHKRDNGFPAHWVDCVAGGIKWLNETFPA